MERNQIEFEVIQEKSGAFAAACFEHRIYVEAENLKELYQKINQAVADHAEHTGTVQPHPDAIQLVLYKEDPETTPEREEVPEEELAPA